MIDMLKNTNKLGGTTTVSTPLEETLDIPKKSFAIAEIRNQDQPEQGEKTCVVDVSIVTK